MLAISSPISRSVRRFLNRGRRFSMRLATWRRHVHHEVFVILFFLARGFGIFVRDEISLRIPSIVFGQKLDTKSFW
jgi:hypothetical protein